jgi:hypothetical protein
MQEFTDVCVFLDHHNGTIFDEKQIMNLSTNIDLDFNEFLGAFRIVDIGDCHRNAKV